MKFTRAIVRPPPPTFANGITTADDGPPDLDRALAQHHDYCHALEHCGLAVSSLSIDTAYPDSCFVEDTAILTARGAIATRPGAPSRAGEVLSVLPALQAYFPDVARIVAPGTVDGGDVCDADGHFLIGLSARTNEDGARQLAELLGNLGYRSSVIDIRDRRRLLHLKSGLSYLGDGRMIVTADVPRTAALAPYELIEVDETERYAANCVRINDQVLVAAGYPQTRAAIEFLGYKVIAPEMSEYRKMDGGPSCLSLRF